MARAFDEREGVSTMEPSWPGASAVARENRIAIVRAATSRLHDLEGLAGDISIGHQYSSFTLFKRSSVAAMSSSSAFSSAAS